MSSHDHTVSVWGYINVTRRIFHRLYPAGHETRGYHSSTIIHMLREILTTHTHTCPSPRSPHHDIKVMSVGSLQEEADGAIIWRGPRKTALIKRFLKDTFWGRLDYLIFDISLLTIILVQTSLRLKLMS